MKGGLLDRRRQVNNPLRVKGGCDASYLTD